MLTLVEIMLIIGVATTTAALATVILTQRRPSANGINHSPEEPLSLLFDEGVLHHATQRALSTFAFMPGAHVWEDLRALLIPRFPEFPDAAGTGAAGSMLLLPRDPQDSSCLEINWRDDLCWVQITDTGDQRGTGRAIGQNMDKLCCDAMPQPMWEGHADTAFAWSNAAYDALCRRFGRAYVQAKFAAAAGDVPQRVSLEGSDGDEACYEVTTLVSQERTLCQAYDVTALVQAERAQRSFVQAISKTFAHLSIGLAVFDQDGRLGIFNPALVDLTGLRPGFLVTQPTMMSFFDQLRENRGMPEPKNYGSWRQDIAELIAAASDGKYHETWTLEDGRTFAVQGRPYPDGSTAFLIEDVSPEVTLTRNFRIEVEQYEALLDSIDDPMVVFSSAGILTFSNAAYRDMWGQNPDAAFADIGILDAIDNWQGQLDAGVEWTRITNFVTTLGQRRSEDIAMRLTGGKQMSCQLLPIASDATLIRFSAVRAGQPSAGAKSGEDVV